MTANGTVKLTLFDCADSDQQGYADTLPKGEEQDTLHAEELGYGH